MHKSVSYLWKVFKDFFVYLSSPCMYTDPLCLLRNPHDFVVSKLQQGKLGADEWSVARPQLEKKCLACLLQPSALSQMLWWCHCCRLFPSSQDSCHVLCTPARSVICSGRCGAETAPTHPPSAVTPSERLGWASTPLPWGAGADQGPAPRPRCSVLTLPCWAASPLGKCLARELLKMRLGQGSLPSLPTCSCRAVHQLPASYS